MAYSLCIVESPAKCAKIQGFLGAGWRVVASMGHIRALEENLDAVGLDRDFQTRYTFLKEKMKTLSMLKEAAEGAFAIFLAADDDREGEAIAYSVALLLNLDPAKAKRAVFHEITETAIKKAVSKPRLLDMNRVEAQQARAVLDMMVGFTISPLLWKHVGSSLSAGRCQTPALRLLVDKEQEITGFKVESSWRISGSWATKALRFEAALHDELESEEDARNYLENIHMNSGGTVVSTKTMAKSDAAPKPLMTSTLQQQASALFGFGPKTTMKAAQRLYEAGKITYMRTDSDVISEEAVAEALVFVEKKYGPEFMGSGKKTVKKDKEVKAQEAHEAIRPTHMEVETVEDTFTSIEIRVYRLIWQRAIQSVMAPAKSEHHLLLFTADGDEAEFVWESMWKRQLFAGWKQVGLVANIDDEEEESAAASTEAWAAATKFKEGDKLAWSKLQANPHETKAPGRYTEATLVRELEKRGIGRPSTFASLVETLLEKGYALKADRPATTIDLTTFVVEKVGQWPPTKVLSKKKVGAEKQKLTPTALGISVLEFCVREFDNLFNYGFTKRMEDRLDLIAKGEESWKAVCRETWGTYKEKYVALNNSKEAKAGRERLFDDGIKAIQSKKGPLLLKEGPGEKEVKFFGWPGVVPFHELSQVQVTEFLEKKGKAGRERLFDDGIKAIQSKKGPLLLKEGPGEKEVKFFGWPGAVPFHELSQVQVTEFLEKKGKDQEGEVLGTFNGTPIVKKNGKFGLYASCGSTNVPIVAEDTLETITEKIQKKSQAFLHTIGPYEFRTGPYGPYMFKKASPGKKPVFVTLPQGLDPKILTEEAAARIYLNQKSVKNK